MIELLNNCEVCWIEFETERGRTISRQASGAQEV